MISSPTALCRHQFTRGTCKKGNPVMEGQKPCFVYNSLLSSLLLVCCTLEKQQSNQWLLFPRALCRSGWAPSSTYCKRSVLRAGRVRALLSMRLRASVECQIVLAGLACIVLSVWHPILCGNPILWGWRKWDCGEWLHHCIRSCCWLLVTLKKGKRRKQLYTTEDRSKHQPEKQHTRSCEYPTHRHHSIPQSSIISPIKKRMPCSSEP